MNAKELQAVLPSIIRSRVSTLLWGWHGVGKSQIVRKVVESMYGERNTPENGGEKTLIDLRLGQMEIGDLTGIPRNIEKDGITRTVWGLPDWWPSHPKSKGVLFVDEINRAASPDVLQASFQLVLDHRLHTHMLPKGWTVIAAANPDDNDYQVLRLDPALMDRFLHLSFSPTKTDWNKWAQDNITERTLREFAMSIPDVLGIKSAPDIPVTSSPRSIELLNRIYAQMTDAERDKYMFTIASGLIGGANAIILKKYLSDKMDKPVDPTVLLNDFSSVRSRIKSWIGSKNKEKKGALRQTRADLLKSQFDIVASFISTDLNDKLTEKQAKNLVAFISMLPVEIAVASLSGLTESDRIGLIEIISPLIVGTEIASRWANILNKSNTKMQETENIDE